MSGPEELQLILAHPFAAWRTFLHPSQREIAYRPSYAGPAQVTGGPGTGKTVTVLHRAAFLAARAATPGGQPASGGPAARSCSPPSTATWPRPCDAQLDLLIRDAAVRSRIEVLNVDRLAYGIVKQARGTPVIADERVLRSPLGERPPLTPGWPSPRRSCKNEWEQVILAQDLRTEQAYLTCLRTGRGRPLTKAQRSQVWQAAQQVTAELAAARESTHLQLANEATHQLPPGGRGLLRQAGTSPTGTCPGRGPDPSGGCFARPWRPARTTCSSRPTRTSASTTTGSPSPACGSACRAAAGGCP